MKIELYNQLGEKLKQIEAPKEIFEVPFNKDLVHRALVRQLNNERIAIAHVKTKGEVRGGGKKPWRQKGTGRARQGSTRNPQWRHGGKAFGPRKERNFETDLPKRQRRLALFSALSEKARSKQVLALDKYEAEPKTKLFVSMLKKLPLKKDVLVVIPEKNATIEKASRNLTNAKTLLVNYLNIADLQKYENILFLEPAIKKLSEIFKLTQTK